MLTPLPVTRIDPRPTRTLHPVEEDRGHPVFQEDGDRAAAIREARIRSGCVSAACARLTRRSSSSCRAKRLDRPPGGHAGRLGFVPVWAQAVQNGGKVADHYQVEQIALYRLFTVRRAARQRRASPPRWWEPGFHRSGGGAVGWGKDSSTGGKDAYEITISRHGPLHRGVWPVGGVPQSRLHPAVVRELLKDRVPPAAGKGRPL